MPQTLLHFPLDTPMTQSVRAFDWGKTSLGPIERWDPTLATLVPIMLASNQPMFILWGDARTLLYNDAYVDILGIKHPDALGQDFLQVWHEIREDLTPLVAGAYRGEPYQMGDIQLMVERRGYAEEAHFSFFYSPLRTASGAVGGVFCGCNETTAQIPSERRLAVSEARYRSVLENMDEGFVLFDRDFTIVEVNEIATRFARLEREDMIGRNHWERFPGSHDAPVGRMYRQVLAKKRADKLEHLYRFPDGRECWYEVRAFPVGDSVAVLFRDVTERRTLAMDAAAAMERVQLALEAGAIIGTWVWNIPEDRFVADERFALNFGLEPVKTNAGLPIESGFEAVHPDDRERVKDAVARAVADRSQYRCQYRVFRDGAWRWVEANGRVQVDADGVPLRFPGVLLDIEERRRVEAERDRATALLETFIDAVPGVVYAKDLEGRLLVGNRGTAELLGRSREDFVGRTDAEILSDPKQAAAIMARDRQIMVSGIAEQAEEAVLRADGTSAIWWSTKEPLRDAEGRVIGLIGTSVDITERKAIEDALRRSEQRSALAMEVAQLGTWTWDLRTGVVSADARCRQMCGLDAQAPAFTLAEIQCRVHPDDWPAVEQALIQALEPDGPGRYAEEFRWLHPDGRVVWTASQGIALFDGEAGNRSATAMMGSVIDITDRRQMIDALQQADRRKDEFLAMLAHELRNPLAPIRTASHVLKLSGGDPQRVADTSAIIERQVRHMTRLVDDLLDVSRVTRGLVQLELTPVDLRAAISTAVEQVKPLVESRSHELRTRMSAGPFIVKGDFHRLVQIASNLLNNAAKYTAPGGVIDVELGIEGRWAILSVADTGIGIAPGMVGRMFDLFTQGERTLDRSQGGLGIGLALVRRLVELHGGEVRAESAGLEQGSRFRVALPLSNDARQDELLSRPTRATSGGRVLVVDDNVDAATMLASALQLVGYRVDTAYDAQSALIKAAADPGWDAFILDIGLPDLSGHDLADQLRKLPGARQATFVALTGYGQAQDRAASRASGFAHHLVKPADLLELTQLLSHALGPR